MLIARHAPYSAKLRRSGMGGFAGVMPPRWGLERFWGAVSYKHGAPLGLALAHRPRGDNLTRPSQREVQVQQSMKELEGMLS